MTSGQFSAAMNASILQREVADRKLAIASQVIVRSVLAASSDSLPPAVRTARAQMVILAVQIIDPKAADLGGNQ